MAHEKKLKQINKHGILIHQLQLQDKDAALSYFSKQSIEKVSYISEGLQIFFKEYDFVIKTIRREKIEVGGLFYKIYPLVTNLTICGIGPYVTDSALEDIRRAYGFTIDVYRIQETMERKGCKTVSLTDDYRVILDIPEVFAPTLMPLRLPNVTKKTFEVLFFCRLCRHNGHKQFQCSHVTKSSSSSISRQNIVSRKMSHESDSTNNCDRPEIDFCVEELSTKIKLGSHIKRESHQKFSRSISDKNSYSKNCSEGATHSKSKKRRNTIACDVDNRKKQQLDSFSSTSVSDTEKFRDNNPSSPKKPSKEILDRSFRKRSFHQHYGSEESNGRIDAPNCNKCSKKQASVNSNNKKKGQLVTVLSKIVPPNVDLYDTKKLIQIAYKCSPEDIPEEIQTVLLSILNYNRELKNKYADKNTRDFLSWISAVLKKIEEKKISSIKSQKDITKFPKKEKQRAKDEKSGVEIPKQRSSVKRSITLSVGIIEAISKTEGVLQPTLLCNFLNQVRGRKNLFQVASAFANNIPALASQLLEVQNTYYKYVQKRGPEEDRDISFIKRLRLRLMQQIKNATQIPAEPGITEVTIKTEPNTFEIPVKTELDYRGTCENRFEPTEVPVKVEPTMTEEQFVKLEFDDRSTCGNKFGLTELPVKVVPPMIEQFVKSESFGRICKNRFGLTEVSLETESTMTEVSVKSGQTDMTDISVKIEPDITDRFVERNYDIAEVSVKKEDDFFMRQSSSNCPNNLYAASYFTNITQMPFSLDL